MTELLQALVAILMFCLVPAPLIWGLGRYIYWLWDDHKMR
jgi:hypothetical protein